MKLSLHSKLIVVAMLLSLPAGIFAATDTHKGSLQIHAPAMVSGSQLPAGDYQLKWDGAGPDVQVSILRDGKAVATVPARVVNLDKKAADDAAEVTTSANGDRSVSRILFGGKTYALEIGQSAAADSNSGGSQK